MDFELRTVFETPSYTRKTTAQNLLSLNPKMRKEKSPSLRQLQTGDKRNPFITFGHFLDFYKEKNNSTYFLNMNRRVNEINS